MATKQSKMLAVWGSPSCGKTVTAMKIAAELAAQKKNVVIVCCDMAAPTMPALLKMKKPIDVSVGGVLTAPTITQELILKNCMPYDKNPYISLLGYKAGENVFTYAEYGRERAVDLLVLLRHIADYVIIDCSSTLTDNILSTTALEVSDEVLRLCSCDLKSISYFMSYMPLIADRKFKSEKQIKVLSHTRAYAFGNEYENAFGGVKYRLPYVSAIEEQAATLALLDSLSGKEAAGYNQVVAGIAQEVFQYAE